MADNDAMRWLNTTPEDVDVRTLVLEYQLDPDSAEFAELLGRHTTSWATAKHTVCELCEMVSKLIARSY